MAVPSPGKCLLLLVLVIVVYNGYGFRIRDALPSGNPERSGACAGHAKCTPDGSRTESWPPLPAGTKRRFDTLGSEGARGKISGRVSTSGQPPVVDDESVETSDDKDDDRRYVGKVPVSFPSGTVDRRIGGKGTRAKFSRIVIKVDDPVTEEVEDEGDLDKEEENEDDETEEVGSDGDDGVEITNGDENTDEDSTEIIDADADDDDNGDDDLSPEKDEDDDDDNGSEAEGSEPDTKDDIDDDEMEEMLASVMETDARPLSQRYEDSDKLSTGKDSKDQDSFKITKQKKPAEKEQESENEETDGKREFRLKERSRTVEESARGKDGAAAKKIEDTSKKKMPRRIKLQGSDENYSLNEKNDDEADEDGDDEKEEDEDGEKASTMPSPIRKLEKVRLADKEKSKPIESHQTIKPVVAKPEKLAKAKVSATNEDEARDRKKKDSEGMNSASKLHIEKSQTATPSKSETDAKKDVPSKSSKIAPASVKSETLKKSTTTTTTTTKDQSKTKPVKDVKAAAAKNKISDPKSEGLAKKPEILNVKHETEVKTSDKKIDSGAGSDKKIRSKSKKHVDATISLTQLNDALLRLPAFVPNFTAVEDPVCQQHGKIFLRQLRGYKLWALQMLDSSAKIPSGLLRGNVNQLGDFDQCLGVTARVKVDEKTVKVQGKYCLATLDVYASIPDMKVPVNFMQSRGFIRANMRDTGHFVPRFTTVNWGMCIPAACSAKDAQNAIEDALSHVNVTSGLKFSIDVDPDMCYVRQKTHSYTKETIGVLYFYAMIICIVLVATARDYIFSPQEKGNYSERIIMSFSLRRTLKILAKVETESAGEIGCIHGIRSLATIALYMAHKMIATAQIPYANRISLTEMANNPMSSLLRTSLAYTDCFLLLSGLLTAFNMARESAKKGEIRWFCRLVARFIRLTPALLVMVFWYAYVMEHIGSGPQWNRVIALNAELCKHNSWTNFLYIQNFFPFEEMCATHTHQLALDMQLSLVAPMLVFFLTLKPIVGILIVFFILQVSATLRYFATTSNNLSLVVYHGISLKQLYKTANLTYTLPLHRATPYVFGVALGVLLYHTGKNVRIYRIFVIFGWLAAIGLGGWGLFSPSHMARRDYVYDVEEAAHYAVIAPVAWSIALCWIIFACFTDHGGIVNKFLSSYWMVLFSRISYAVYISQFAVFFYNVGTTRYSGELQLQRYIDPIEAIAVIAVSVVITLLIDIPMQEVKNVIMESTANVASAKGETEATEEIATKEKTAMAKVVELGPAEQEEAGEREEEADKSRSWLRQDDAMDGLTRLEDSEGEEYLERWRPRTKSNGREGSHARRDRYVDGEELEDEEPLEEEETEEERPTEWSWVRESRSRVAIEDDGLLEHRRSRSSRRGSHVEPEVRQSSAHRYQADESSRHDRRSLSRQRDRSSGESPRSSVKRERSTSRASETRTRYSEAEDSANRKRSSRLESRGSSVSRDQERATTPSWETVGRSPRRERSASRASESRITETEDVPLRYSRPPSRSGPIGRDQDRTLSWEATRHERSPSRAPTTPRREVPRLLSSGSEEEPPRTIKSSKRQQPAEPKISDEEDWEQELRIRRRKFMERLASEDREARIDEGNDGWNSVRRRSSAEGKLALLKDPTGSNVMDSWTVSRGPRVSLLGSSQETEDDASSRRDQPAIQRESSLKEDERSEEESSQERSRRRSYTSGSQVTSLEEEEENTVDEDFVLNKDSRRITVMDLSKLSQSEELQPTGRAGGNIEAEEQDGRPIMATLKLFKRESIVKSQASEEDPEYLLPERPKLQEQEQDHPFKKAWQLQKSRSEEDPTPYALKEVKTLQEPAKSRPKPTEDREIGEPGSTEGSGGPQSLLSRFRDSGDDATCLGRSVDREDRRSSSKSTTGDSSKLESPSEDERLDLYKPGRKETADEANYEWELGET